MMAGIAAVSAALLMTELALTRIFSVTMYYHFAFLAISIALLGLNYSPENLWLMLAIYALASLPFFTGGSVMSIAFSRMADRINVLYAADLIGAATGCLALIPLLN